MLGDDGADFAPQLEGEVMKGAEPLPIAVEGAAGVLKGMLRGIPTAIAEVHASAEDPLVIDQNELLVVRGAKRMTIVENNVESRMKRVPFGVSKFFALKKIKIGVVPNQDADLKVSFFREQTEEQLSQSFRGSFGRAAQAKA